jgi:hypothetical protein
MHMDIDFQINQCVLTGQFFRPHPLHEISKLKSNNLISIHGKFV